MQITGSSVLLLVFPFLSKNGYNPMLVGLSQRRIKQDHWSSHANKTSRRTISYWGNAKLLASMRTEILLLKARNEKWADSRYKKCEFVVLLYMYTNMLYLHPSAATTNWLAYNVRRTTSAGDNESHCWYQGENEKYAFDATPVGQRSSPWPCVTRWKSR